MRRREFITLLGGVVTAWPLSAECQLELRPNRVPIVGFVGFASAAVDNRTLMPLRQAINALGYTQRVARLSSKLAAPREMSIGATS
jgi:putative ABC transport system substrate-binding protein